MFKEKIKKIDFAYPPQDYYYHYSTQQLTFNVDKDLTVLAGYLYGLQIFKTQIEPYIRYDADIVSIVFPNNVQIVTISFLEGFFTPALEVLGNMDAVKEKIQIYSPSKYILKKYLELE